MTKVRKKLKNLLAVKRIIPNRKNVYLGSPNYGSLRIYDLVVTRGQLAVELCLRIEPAREDKVHIGIFQG